MRYGVAPFLYGPIGMFVFNTVQIPSGCLAPTCIPLAKGLGFLPVLRISPASTIPATLRVRSLVYHCHDITLGDDSVDN